MNIPEIIIFVLICVLFVFMIYIKIHFKKNKNAEKINNKFIKGYLFVSDTKDYLIYNLETNYAEYGDIKKIDLNLNPLLKNEIKNYEINFDLSDNNNIIIKINIYPVKNTIREIYKLIYNNPENFILNIILIEGKTIEIINKNINSNK